MFTIHAIESFLDKLYLHCPMNTS